MRVSSRCVLIENDKVLLIYREKNDRIYYVFPGGGVEDGETNEECLIRECREELGIKINIIKQLYEVKGKDFLQHFFLIYCLLPYIQWPFLQHLFFLVFHTCFLLFSLLNSYFSLLIIQRRLKSPLHFKNFIIL